MPGGLLRCSLKNSTKKPVSRAKLKKTGLSRDTTSLRPQLTLRTSAGTGAVLYPVAVTGEPCHVLTPLRCAPLRRTPRKPSSAPVPVSPSTVRGLSVTLPAAYSFRHWVSSGSFRLYFLIFKLAHAYASVKPGQEFCVQDRNFTCRTGILLAE